MGGRSYQMGVIVVRLGVRRDKVEHQRWNLIQEYGWGELWLGWKGKVREREEILIQRRFWSGRQEEGLVED